MFDVFKDEALEAAAREAIRLDEPRALLDRFVTLVRESGTADEEAAGHYLVERLQAFGVPVTLHTPDLYISLPERAALTIAGAGGTTTVRARPPAMARSTGDEPVEGEVCYVPSRYAAGTSSLFDMPDAARGSTPGADPVAGRIVLTEGFSMPGTVQAFERRGAIAQIYIHPGERIHEGICTSIWGAPTLESIGRKPTTPVVCINHPDGESLIAAGSARSGPRLGANVAARGLDALPAAGRRDPRPRGSRRVPARARALRFVVRGHRRQRHRRRRAPRAGAGAVDAPRVG